MTKTQWFVRIATGVAVWIVSVLLLAVLPPVFKCLFLAGCLYALIYQIATLPRWIHKQVVEEIDRKEEELRLARLKDGAK